MQTANWRCLRAQAATGALAAEERAAAGTAELRSGHHIDSAAARDGQASAPQRAAVAGLPPAPGAAAAERAAPGGAGSSATLASPTERDTSAAGAAAAAVRAPGVSQGGCREGGGGQGHERRVLTTPVPLCTPTGAPGAPGARGGGAPGSDLPDAVYDTLQARAGQGSPSSRGSAAQRALDLSVPPGESA